MSAEYRDGKLRVFTLPEFVNYERQETSDRLILILSFYCTGETRTLSFIQRLKAVNNFDPEFSKSTYEILIPTPLFAGLDITMFLMVSSMTLILLETYFKNGFSGFCNNSDRL